jgi:uncharacterized protein (DUF362 family)
MKRRDFIRSVGAGLAFGGSVLHGCKRDGSRAAVSRKGGPARVAVFRDDEVRRGEGLDPGRVDGLLQMALRGAFGSPDAASGLRSVVSDGDVVGIKLNCLAGRPLSPTRGVVDALVGVLKQAGISAGDMIFFERGERDIRKGGFEVRRGGDGPRFIGNDSPGCGYQPEPEISGRVGSCLSRIVTDRIDVMINLGVLKDHNLAGLGAGMKNLFGIIHNPNKYHEDCCDPYVADVLAFPVVQKKLRLTILDALTAQYEGGPGYLPAYAFEFNGILASTDPVALDRVALDLVDAQRKKKGLPSLEEAGRPPAWIQTAEKRGLGVGDLAKIQVVSG